MGGNHYYCDYCERSFKDAQGARKKHLESIQHLKNKQAHYQRFKDPEVILQEELAKNPCQRHMRGQYCQYESLCRYSHYTPDQIEYLKARVAAKYMPPPPPPYPADPAEIIKKHCDEELDDVELEQIKDLDYELWPAPVNIEGLTVVPPSCQPITFRNFIDCKFAEWGLPPSTDEPSTSEKKS